MNNNILVFGNGGLARQLEYDIISLGYIPLFFEDGQRGSLEDLLPLKSFILGLSKPSIRKDISNRLINLGFLPKVIISPNVHLPYSCSISDNITVLRDSVIEPNVYIGYGTLINVGVFLHHGSHLGEFCEVAPRATILGNVTIGDLTFIGAGSIIREDIRIGNECIIGCGSVVINNIPNNEVWAGNPAKFLKKNIK
jgi:sugar O-acyltransferase (sialic acid O-acetyltransferase NeuD family)